MALKVTRRRSISIAIVAIFLLAVSFIAWGLLRPLDGTQEPSSVQPAPLVSQQPAEQTIEQEESMVEKAPTSALAPEEVSEVEIEALSIKVSYAKGISGFSYSIGRSGDGTQYIDFYTESLKGTKCTDDEGVFATIIEKPDTTDSSGTVALTKKVGEVQYGLSLPSATCTSDPALFAQYQAAFKDGFGLLQAL